MIDEALDGIPTGRGARAEDGGVAELLARVLEPFAVLGLCVSVVWNFSSGGGRDGEGLPLGAGGGRAGWDLRGCLLVGCVAKRVGGSGRGLPLAF